MTAFVPPFAKFAPKILSVLVKVFSHFFEITTHAAHDFQLVWSNDMAKDVVDANNSFFPKRASCIGKVDQLTTAIFWIGSYRDISAILKHFE